MNDCTSANINIVRPGLCIIATESGAELVKSVNLLMCPFVLSSSWHTGQRSGDILDKSVGESLCETNTVTSQGFVCVCVGRSDLIKQVYFIKKIFPDKKDILTLPCLPVASFYRHSKK